MISINLLPWREVKLRQQRRYFLAQLFIAVVLPVIVAGIVWAKQIGEIEYLSLQIGLFKSDNQHSFTEIKNFQTGKMLYLKQLEQAELVNRLIAKRDKIPQLLFLLENKTVSFQIDYLSINQNNITLRGTDSSSESVLSFLTTLRSESNFCQVTFTPLETKTPEVVQFELHAELCDGKNN